MLISSLQLCKRIKQLLECQYVLDTNWLWESGPKCVLHLPKFMESIIHPNMHVKSENETFVVGGEGDVVFSSHC